MTPFDAAIKGAREIAGPVIAMTITLAAVYAPIGFTIGPHRRAVPRIRLHAGGRGHRLGRRRADAVADDVLEAAEAACRSWAGSAASSTACSAACSASTGAASTARIKQRAVFAWIAVLIVALSAVLYNAHQPRAGAGGGPGHPVRLRQGAGTRQPRLSDDLHRRADRGSDRRSRRSRTCSPSTAFRAPHSAFTGLIMKPGASASGRDLSGAWHELQPKFTSCRRASASSPSRLPPLPGGAGELAGASSCSPIHGDYTRLAEVLDQLDAEAHEERPVHLHRRRPEVRHAAGRADRSTATRPTSSASPCSDIGATLATLLGGNYVNRFDLEGRSYQVIPQVPRDRARDVDQILQLPGARVRWQHGAAVDRSRRSARRCSRTRSSTFQQLNSATLSGRAVPGPHLGEALDFLKQKADEILPQGMAYDFQGESRQYVQEGNTLADHLRLRADGHLPGARRAVRELPRSASSS